MLYGCQEKAEPEGVGLMVVIHLLLWKYISEGNYDKTTTIWCHYEVNRHVQNELLLIRVKSEVQHYRKLMFHRLSYHNISL